MKPEPAFASPEQLAAELAAGRMVILVDDEDRENEGDLIVAAEFATPAAINFMITQARGLVCLALTQKDAARLDLTQMVSANTDTMRTAFTVSFDSAEARTGISAYERSSTIIRAADADSTATDFRRPGHVFPVVAREGGVLRRAGHTEAAVDMALLAGCRPAAVICEIVRDDGQMARLPDLQLFAEQHNLLLGTIADLIAWRRLHHRAASPVRRAAEATLPTAFGTFRILAYLEVDTGTPHIALVCGDLAADGTSAGCIPPLVRMHSECMTGDVFFSRRCDCGLQLSSAMARIAEEGRGALVYLRQEGRGIGLVSKLQAYALQEAGMDTVDANIALGYAPDPREYGIGAAILADLGITEVRLMTNNPRKVAGLSGYGVRVTETVPTHISPTCENLHYLETKRDRMGHLFPAEMNGAGAASTQNDSRGRPIS